MQWAEAQAATGEAQVAGVGEPKAAIPKRTTTAGQAQEAAVPDTSARR